MDLLHKIMSWRTQLLSMIGAPIVVTLIELTPEEIHDSEIRICSLWIYTISDHSKHLAARTDSLYNAALTDTLHNISSILQTTVSAITISNYSECLVSIINTLTDSLKVFAGVKRDKISNSLQKIFAIYNEHQKNFFHGCVISGMVVSMVVGLVICSTAIISCVSVAGCGTITCSIGIFILLYSAHEFDEDPHAAAISSCCCKLCMYTVFCWLLIACFYIGCSHIQNEWTPLKCS